MTGNDSEISSNEARAALDAANAASRSAVKRARKPFWLDLFIAVLVAGMVLAQTQPPPLSTFVIAGLVIILAASLRRFRQRDGVQVSKLRLGWTLVITLTIAVLVVFASLVAMKASRDYGLEWPGVAASIAIFFTVLVGRRLWWAAYRANTAGSA
tara:strand:+ start:1882 stop:2346 length:465 start_codon:yes stop_codon:yes gene_type:complete